MFFWCHRLDQFTTEKFDKVCPTHSRSEFVKFFGGILVQTMTPKGHFEINWPLGVTQHYHKFTIIIWEVVCFSDRKNSGLSGTIYATNIHFQWDFTYSSHPSFSRFEPYIKRRVLLRRVLREISMFMMLILPMRSL